MKDYEILDQKEIDVSPGPPYSPKFVTLFFGKDDSGFFWSMDPSVSRTYQKEQETND